MKLNNIIKKIHRSDLYGIFVELGAGSTLINELSNIDSYYSTIYKSIILHSNESQIEYGKRENMVPDSLSSTSSILGKFILDEYATNNNINFIIVSSFQIGKNTINHGWISIYYKNKLYYYHVTLPEYTNRVDIKQKIGELQIKLIYNIIFDKSIPVLGLDVASNNYIDLLNKDNNSVLVFNPDHKLERLETTFKEFSNEMILFKGSFNPIHEAHLEIMESVADKYKNVPKAFCISLSNFDLEKNKNINNVDILNRIKSINNLGYYVIIMNTALFKDSIKLLNERLNVRIILPMGYDIFTKCNLKDFEGLNYKLIVFDRNNLFSNSLINTSNIEFIKYNNPISSSEINSKNVNI